MTQWTKENIKILLACESDSELQENFPGQKIETLRRQQRAFREKSSPTEKLIKFMSKGRTEIEMAEQGIALSDLNVKGYELYTTRNTFGEPMHLLLPAITKTKIKKKAWTYHWADDQPYIMIQLPDNGARKIKIVPIADVHYGSVAHMTEKFREYINWIAATPNVYAFIVGDLFENSHGDSNKGVSMYEQEVRPKKQIDDMVEILSPIAHKILWAIPGNHEDRSRIRDYDPLERMCEQLEIPYSFEAVYADVLWNGYVFTFHTAHGKSASMTKGGKLNSAIRPQAIQEHVMFTVSAHVHDAMVNWTTRICRDRKNVELQLKKQYVIICPSFMSYFKSYASKAGYEPGGNGVITCIIYPNGEYHASI
jgi:hypothetical protein